MSVTGSVRLLLLQQAVLTSVACVFHWKLATWPSGSPLNQICINHVIGQDTAEKTHLHAEETTQRCDSHTKEPTCFLHNLLHLSSTAIPENDGIL